jgi:isoleucyl-tRNA synthetase
VWWILKQLWDKDLLYQGYKVVPYCPVCGTPLSSHEVSLGYEDVDDPSVFVRFPVKDAENTYLLAWTTTPWTLPGNVALAVNEKVDSLALSPLYLQLQVIIFKGRFGINSTVDFAGYMK